MTPEQAEAYVNLDTALRAVMAHKGLRDDEVVMAFAVIAHIEPMDPPPDDDVSRYLTVYPNGRQAAHVTTGLFHTAIEVVAGGWTRDDEEDA